MAKKVVIGDLVVKVGVDSSGTTRALNRLQNQLNNTQNRTNRGSRRGLKTETERTKQAREQAKAAKAAARSEANKLRAMQRDAAIRRRIGEAEDRRERRRRAQEIRHQTLVARNQRLRNRMIQNGFGSAGRGVGTLARGAAMGAVGGGALAGAGLIGATNNARSYRVGEQLLEASYAQRGVGGEDIRANKERLYGQSQYYNLDPAALFGQMGQMMMNMPTAPAQDVEGSVLGMSILGKAMGVGDPDIARSMKGFQQFMVSQTSENLNQMTEAMPVLLASVAKAFGMSVADLKKAQKGGELQAAMEASGGKEKFLKAMMNATQTQGTALFERNKGKLPEVLDDFTNTFSHLVRLFGTNAEGGVMQFLTKLTDWMKNNEQTVVAAGEWMSIAMGRIADSMGEVMEKIQPYLDEWAKSWDKMSDEQKANQVKNAFEAIGTAFEYLFIAFAASKVLALVAGIMGIVATINKARALMVAGAAGGATAVGASGMKNLGKMGLLGTAIAGGLALGEYSEDAASKILGDWIKYKPFASDESTIPTGTGKPDADVWKATMPQPIFNVINNIETKDPDTEVESSFLSTQ